MAAHHAQCMTAAPPGDDVSLSVRGTVATITIERPAKINAIRLSTWHALRGLVVAADNDPAVGVIVVRGSGGHFSAGNDIAALSMFPGHPAEAEVFGTAWADAIRSIEAAAKPVVMAIEGICYGSALAMSLAGDFRVASSNARFSIPVAKLGALYLRSDFQRLVATIGMGQSRKLVYSSEAFDAAQALRIGLVDEVFPAERFDADLDGLLDTMQARSPFTLRHAKAMLRDIGSEHVEPETGDELAAFARATQCEDFAEGIFAFLHGRTARFRRM